MNAGAEPISQADSLSQDLRMVFSRALPTFDEGGPAAAIDGVMCKLDDAIKKAVERLAGSVAPAIVGLGGLSIEAAEQAVTLAEQLRGRLLPHPAMDPVQTRQRVSFHAGLADALHADLRVVANESPDSKDALASLTLAVDERVPNALFMAVNDLDAVLRLRQALANDGVVAIRKLTSLPVNHVIVMLPPSVDARVVSQWHLLAANLQTSLRMSVIITPHADTGNLRGVIELIAVRTGQNAWAGGLDFATGEALSCPGFEAHMERNGCDVTMDAGFNPNPCRATIRISADIADAERSEIWFRGGVTRGIAARVLRFDGSMLWLCDEPSTAPVDPTVELLKRIGVAL